MDQITQYIAYEYVGLEDICKFTQVSSSVAVCFPRNLIESIVEPVADISPRKSPLFFCHCADVHFKY
jgi:hypothetical protein